MGRIGVDGPVLSRNIRRRESVSFTLAPVTEWFEQRLIATL